jgi:predicted ATPase
MALRASFVSFASRRLETTTGGPRAVFAALTSRGVGLVDDEAQTRALDALERVYHASLSTRSTSGATAGRGVWLHGGVGRGKTLCADALSEALRIRRGIDETHMGKRDSMMRTHFHAFMSWAHRKMHEDGWSADAAASVGETLAKERSVLVLDEIEISDVADAMMWMRIMEAFFARGGVLVGTSNSAPWELYRGGINREAFRAFAEETLPTRCETIDFATERNVDWRRWQNDGSNEALRVVPVVIGHDDEAQEKLKEAWNIYTRRASTDDASIVERVDVDVPVGGGATRRVMRAKRCVENRAVWFTFDNICGRASNAGPSDYIKLAQSFPIIAVENVPRLTVSAAENEARRFINLIDVLYEHRVSFLANLESSPDDMFKEKESDSALSSSELTTRQRTRLETASTLENLSITAIGGSSGRSTTMLAPDTEWSATGRVGASLAHASASNFVLAASARAASRLAHMSRGLLRVRVLK